MTAHPTAAEKLLAMLDDGDMVETLSVDEVREDLALLGIDPAPSIAFAHALAAGHGTPGGRLLGGIGAAEDAEDEIARIESASIEEVRAKIPGGSAAAIAAEARRKAGVESNVVGIQRRRRSRMLVWGGPLAGIAASLLVVVVGYEVLMVNYVNGPMQRAVSPSATESEAAPSATESEAAPSATESEAAPSATESEAPMFGMFASEADESGDAAVAKRARRDAGAPAAAAAPPAAVTLGNETREALADDMAPSDADKDYSRSAPDSAAEKPKKKSVAGTGSGAPETGDTVVGLLAEPALPEQGRSAESFAGESVAVEPDAQPRIVAVLVVDAGLAPESVKSRSFSAGLLADRLDEARRLAAGRDVIALIGLETPTGRIDFVQVSLLPGMTQQLAPPAPLAGLLGADAAAYDFIALPVP